MRPRLPLLAAATSCLLIAASPADAKPCGNYPDENGNWTLEPIQGAGIYNVRASEDLPCAVARRVARNAYRHNRRGETTWLYNGTWRCTELASGYEYVKVRCVAQSGRRVRWEAGASACGGDAGRRLGRLGRKFESLSYSYTDYGPYEILQGEASADGSTGSGVLRYTKEYARPDESEVGEVHDIQISWQGDTATVINPDTYSNPYTYAKSLRSTEACSG